MNSKFDDSIVDNDYETGIYIYNSSPNKKEALDKNNKTRRRR